MEKPLLDKIIIKSFKNDDILIKETFKTYHEVLSVSKKVENLDEILVGDMIRIIVGSGEDFYSKSFDLNEGESLRLISYSSALTKKVN